MYQHFTKKISHFIFISVRFIERHDNMIKEGEIRAKELNEHLENINAPKYVWISEDGTSIQAKVEYHSKSNQLIELALPLNQPKWLSDSRDTYGQKCS